MSDKEKVNAGTEPAERNPEKTSTDGSSYGCHSGRRMSPYERTRAQVYATGNRWAIENFEATHN